MKDKIPFYNIVNMFFVGAVFSLCLIILLHSYIPFDRIKENAELLSDWSVLISAVLLIAMYELGFIINRLGSIVIAPLYSNKKLRIWPKVDYKIDVSEIAQINPRFQSMITELNLTRSHIMMCAILSVIAFIVGKWIWGVSFAILIIVFTFSGRKHNGKINVIRQSYSERKEKEKKDNQKIKDYISNE